MPLYVYEVVGTGEQFEIQQSIEEPALTTHPTTGAPVSRRIQAPHLNLKHTPGQLRDKLSRKHLEKNGFTRYERDKLTGRYHKTAGTQGPDQIERPPEPTAPQGLIVGSGA